MRYQNGDISIDDSFARFGSKSYAIDKINSVDIREETEKKKGWFFLALAGALFTFTGVTLMGVEQGGSGIIGVLFGAFLIIFAWRNWRYAPKTTFTLLLTTSSAEAQATQSDDRAEVSRIRTAIEGAMARH